jgi:hypothetical protein
LLSAHRFGSKDLEAFLSGTNNNHPPPLPWYQALAILAIMTQPTKVGGKYRLCGKLAFAEAV